MSIFIGSGRSQLSSSDWTITASSGGSLTANNYIFTLQGETEVGKNYPLESSTISVSNGQKITITINSSALKNGENWKRFIIGRKINNDYFHLFKIECKNPNSLDSFLTFPLTISINVDSLLTPGNVVTSLPSTNLIHGQRVSYLGFLYEYNFYDLDSTASSTLLVDGTRRWKQVYSLSTEVDDIEDIGGCYLDLTSNIDISNFELPTYNLTGLESNTITYWITSDSVLEEGTIFDVIPYIGDLDMSNLFRKKIILEPLGIVNTNTGILRTSKNNIPFTQVGKEIRYKEEFIFLEDTLEIGEAYSVRISIELSDVDLGYNLPSETGIYLNISPTKFNAEYNSAGFLFGTGVILNEGNLRRIYPNIGLSCIAETGKGIVQDYSFPMQPKDTNISDIVANTSNQKIAITRTGVCYLESFSIPSDCALRAVISTASGESKSTSWQNVSVASNSSQIALKVTYPTTIRNDYPDVIAGRNNGKFSAFKVRVYLKLGSSIGYTDFSITPESLDDTFQITTLGTSISDKNNAVFGLYTPNESITTTIGTGGSLASGSYQISYSFIYNGNQITDISHNTTIVEGQVVYTTISELYEDNLVNILNNNTYYKQKYSISQLESLDDSNILDGTIYIVKTNSGIFLYSFEYGNLTIEDGFKVIRSSNDVGSFVNLSIPKGNAGGDLTGTYPNPTLNSTGVTSGTYNAGNSVVTIDSKGRVTSIVDNTPSITSGQKKNPTVTVDSHGNIQSITSTSYTDGIFNPAKVTVTSGVITSIEQGAGGGGGSSGGGSGTIDSSPSIISKQIKLIFYATDAGTESFNLKVYNSLEEFYNGTLTGSNLNYFYTVSKTVTTGISDLHIEVEVLQSTAFSVKLYRIEFGDKIINCDSDLQNVNLLFKNDSNFAWDFNSSSNDYFLELTNSGMQIGDRSIINFSSSIVNWNSDYPNNKKVILKYQTDYIKFKYKTDYNSLNVDTYLITNEYLNPISTSSSYTSKNVYITTGNEVFGIYFKKKNSTSGLTIQITITELVVSGNKLDLQQLINEKRFITNISSYYYSINYNSSTSENELILNAGYLGNEAVAYFIFYFDIQKNLSSIAVNKDSYSTEVLAEYDSYKLPNFSLYHQLADQNSREYLLTSKTFPLTQYHNYSFNSSSYTSNTISIKYKLVGTGTLKLKYLDQTSTLTSTSWTTYTTSSKAFEGDGALDIVYIPPTTGNWEDNYALISYVTYNNIVLDPQASSDLIWKDYTEVYGSDFKMMCPLDKEAVIYLRGFLHKYPKSRYTTNSNNINFKFDYNLDLDTTSRFILEINDENKFTYSGTGNNTSWTNYNDSYILKNGVNKFRFILVKGDGTATTNNRIQICNFQVGETIIDLSDIYAYKGWVHKSHNTWGSTSVDYNGNTINGLVSPNLNSGICVIDFYIDIKEETANLIIPSVTSPISSTNNTSLYERNNILIRKTKGNKEALPLLDYKNLPVLSRRDKSDVDIRFDYIATSVNNTYTMDFSCGSNSTSITGTSSSYHSFSTKPGIYNLLWTFYRNSTATGSGDTFKITKLTIGKKQYRLYDLLSQSNVKYLNWNYDSSGVYVDSSISALETAYLNLTVDISEGKEIDLLNVSYSSSSSYPSYTGYIKYIADCQYPNYLRIYLNENSVTETYQNATETSTSFSIKPGFNKLTFIFDKSITSVGYSDVCKITEIKINGLVFNDFGDTSRTGIKNNYEYNWSNSYNSSTGKYELVSYSSLPNGRQSIIEYTFFVEPYVKFDKRLNINSPSSNQYLDLINYNFTYINIDKNVYIDYNSTPSDGYDFYIALQTDGTARTISWSGSYVFQTGGITFNTNKKYILHFITWNGYFYCDSFKEF